MKKLFNISQLDIKQMPIIGFSGPSDEIEFEGKVYPSLKTDKIFKLYAESGINCFMNTDDDYKYRPLSVEKTLEFCNKYGLNYIVYDTSLFNNDAFRDKDTPVSISYDAIEKHFNNYLSNNRCAGVFVIDEPNKDCLSKLREVLFAYKTQFNKMQLQRFCFTNLLPWNKNSGTDEASYDEYLDYAVKYGGLDYLCYDFYPFISEKLNIKDNISPGIYNLVAQVGRRARAHNIPFMAFVQLGGNWTNDPMYPSVRRPTPNEIIWMVNLYLAYGVKGIAYFIPFQSSSFFKYLKHGGQTGIITPQGEKSDLYEPVKQANLQVQAVDEFLLLSEFEKVIIYGDTVSSIEYDKEISFDTSFNKLVGVHGDSCLIGCFNYYGKTALYVVNNSITRLANINLDFDDYYDIFTCDYKSKDFFRDNNVSLSLLAGQAKLIIL